MMLLRYACLGWLVFQGLPMWAQSTITITLINNSDTEFRLSRTEARPGGKLSVDTDVLAPSSQVIVVGTIMSAVDLSGTIFFNDGEDRFTVRVRRLKHFGQPSFAMHAKSVRAAVDSLEFNSDGIPDHLAYTAATVTLKKTSTREAPPLRSRCIQ